MSKTGKEIRTFQGHTSEEPFLHIFLPDGSQALSASYDNTLRALGCTKWGGEESWNIQDIASQVSDNLFSLPTWSVCRYQQAGIIV